MTEVELKFFDSDLVALEEKIKTLGAVLVYDTDTTTVAFTKPGLLGYDTSKNSLRIRKIGEDVFVTFKTKKDDESTMTVKDELEFKINDFQKGILLFSKLGFARSPEYLKRRKHYELGTVHFEFESVPGFPEYLEIETTNEQDMHAICAQIGLDIHTGKKGTLFEIYPRYNH